MLNGRTRTAIAAASLAVSATVASVCFYAPAHAAPSVQDVQTKVDTLFHQAEQIGEDYDSSQVRLQSLQSELASLKADQSAQQAQLDAVKAQLRDSMMQQFEGSNLSAAAEVVLSHDPSAFLSQLNTMSAYDTLQSGVYHDYATQVQAMNLRQSATQQRVQQIADTQAKLAADKKAIDDKLAQAKQQLDSLQASQRQALLSRDAVRTVDPASVGATGNAASAVSFALAQVGKAYVYGAAGDSAYDCSGLTMRAWGAAGVSLPHSAAAQYGMGPHIAESDLRPGDLVFYYSPISHVGMYIGNGLIVNAENPSVGVKVVPLHSMPYVGAVRPG